MEKPEIIVSGFRISFVSSDVRQRKDVQELLNGLVELYTHGYGKIELTICENGGDTDLVVAKRSKPHRTT